MIQNDGYRTGGTPLRGAGYGSRGKWDGLYTESEVEPPHIRTRATHGNEVWSEGNVLLALRRG